MITQTLGEDEYGNPVVIITVAGPCDIYRLQANLMQAQVEFGQLARRCFPWLRKHMGASNFNALDRQLSGGLVTENGWHKPIPKENQ